MDRMDFIPGTEARQQMHDAKGRITISGASKDHLYFANEFVLPCMRGKDTVAYQAMMAALGDSDELEIVFGLRDAQPGEELPSGELPGMTRAFLHEAGRTPKLLYEVGRKSDILHDRHAQRLFNAYREKLAGFRGVDAPTPLDEGTDELKEEEAVKTGESEESETISRALAPSSLYFASGLMFYFVDVSPPPSHPLCAEQDIRLTRPMRAYEALVLSALLTMVWHRPPLVFAVIQNTDRLGKMPLSYQRITFADLDMERVLPDKNKEEISLVF